MSKIRKLATLIALAATMTPIVNTTDLPQLEVKVKNKDELNKAKGLKRFLYGKNSLWAINQKNADRKAHSLNWI
jgi:hypothetical protein